MKKQHPSPLWAISIHALRKESDQLCERTFVLSNISIHALHKESDSPVAIRSRASF